MRSTGRAVDLQWLPNVPVPVANLLAERLQKLLGEKARQQKLRCEFRHFRATVNGFVDGYLAAPDREAYFGEAQEHLKAAFARAVALQDPGWSPEEWSEELEKYLKYFDPLEVYGGARQSVSAFAVKTPVSDARLLLINETRTGALKTAHGNVDAKDGGDLARAAAREFLEESIGTMDLDDFLARVYWYHAFPIAWKTAPERPLLAGIAEEQVRHLNEFIRSWPESLQERKSEEECSTRDLAYERDCERMHGILDGFNELLDDLQSRYGDKDWIGIFLPVSLSPDTYATKDQSRRLVSLKLARRSVKQPLRLATETKDLLPPGAKPDHAGWIRVRKFLGDAPAARLYSVLAWKRRGDGWPPVRRYFASLDSLRDE